MTAVWGPMGWMTLHSIASLYPDHPSQSERDLMSSVLFLFQDTITCAHCRDHFTTMLSAYRSAYPNFLQSRHDFLVFTFRAHNAVNRRLQKPLQGSVEECMALLRNAVKGKHATEYRNAYYTHIGRYWQSMQDTSGMVALKRVQELRKIEADYMKSRDTNFAPDVRPDITILPREILEREIADETRRIVQSFSSKTVRGGFRVMPGGGMRLF